MATTAQSLLDKAQALMIDDGVRCPADEALEWLNDGQREIAIARPDLFSRVDLITCVAGTKQTIPSWATKLMRVTRNMGTSGTTPGRAIRPASMALLDASVPNWHTRPASTEIYNVVTDAVSPRTFYVYPPATAGIKIEFEGGTSSTDVQFATDSITVDDMFGPALVNYICFRAYSKDTDFGGAADRAAAYRQLFDAAVAARTTADNAVPSEAGG